MSRTGDLVLSLTVVGAAGPLYTGLLHWNRAATRTSQPGDVLNGLGAVLVFAAMGNTVLAEMGKAGTSGVWALRQAHLLSLGALVVLLGTCLSVAGLAQLTSDRQMRLLCVLCTVGLLAETVFQVSGTTGQTARPAVWIVLVVAAVVTIGRVRTDPASQVVAASSQSATVGALVVLVLATGALVWAATSDVAGAPIAYAAVAVAMVCVRLFRVVQDLELLAQTRAEALTDELTGVGNRRALQRGLAASLEDGGVVSVLIIDLDRFKEINDRYGHAVGDRLLVSVAGRFVGLLPDGAWLTRTGGDEFAAVLPGLTGREAHGHAAALREAVLGITHLDGLRMRLDVSIGIAEGSALAPEELTRQADTAMYVAKSRREGVRRYDSDLDAQAQEQLQLAEDLHIAVADGQIAVYYQPQIDSGGRVAGAEALVRWSHPRLGLLGPDRFLDIAEANGLMGALTTLVLQDSTREAASWAESGHHLRLSVNLSANCLIDPGLIPLLDSVLADGMPAERLVLELTESMLMQDPEHALDVMNEIAARGVDISIDDYGTGYSSLAYLDHIPASELKIDRSFTSRVLDTPRTRAIVAATVELAHQLGMRSIAEGVEDDDTRSAMLALGCDETQGYLHARPLSGPAFHAWLDGQRLRRPVPRQVPTRSTTAVPQV